MITAIFPCMVEFGRMRSSAKRWKHSEFGQQRSPPPQCLLWGEFSEEHKERARLHLSFIEAAPFCMNKYLLGQQGFYSPSARALSRDGGDVCSGPCSNMWLIIYLQQNGWERLRQRARGQVCSLMAGVFGCQGRLWILSLQISDFFRVQVALLL